jgi:hypothetical protein
MNTTNISGHCAYHLLWCQEFSRFFKTNLLRTALIFTYRLWRWSHSELDTVGYLKCTDTAHTYTGFFKRFEFRLSTATYWMVLQCLHLLCINTWSYQMYGLPVKQCQVTFATRCT